MTSRDEFERISDNMNELTRMTATNRIIATMESLSLDELSEALDECGCEEIAEVDFVLGKLSSESIARFERVVNNLANYSIRADF